MAKTPPLTEETLKALVSNELRQAVGFYGGKLAEQRRKAESYYYALPEGDLAPPEVEGRASVVVPRVRNTILSMIPPLMVKFCGGDSVVEFEATKPGDEKSAQYATDYCNYIFFKQNNGHGIVRAWFTDALKYKNGIVKVWWDDRHEETREEYDGLTQIELAQLADDEEVEITEQNSYPDEEDGKQRQQAIEQMSQQLQQAMQAAQQGNQQAAQAAQQMQAQLAHIQSQPPAMLFDIVCTRTKKGGKVCIENVPPEEFGINRDAKTIKDARFIRHSILRTVSDLRSMGYPEEKLETIGSDENSMSFNMERVERNQFDDELAASGVNGDVNTDPSQRRVWVHECYIRVDADGDGIAELRKVTLAGNEILDNAVVDLAPFVSICPVPEPHKFYGLSVSDLSMEGQKIETDLLRTMIDNNRLQTNGRFFAVEGQVNLDDLLMSRPGGVVRVKSPQSVGRLEQGMGDMKTPMELLQYMENFNADSTGYSSQSQSFDVEALSGSETATKTRIVSNKASMRTDDVARNFAEGFVELFRLVLKIVCQRQNKKQAIQLSGEWVDLDPREWKNQFNASINVGLGVGDKDQQVSHLGLLMQTQQHMLPMGIANPSTCFEAAVELEKALGYKGNKFFVKPDPNKPPPNPAMQEMQAKLQGQMQLEQGKAQIKAQIDQQQMSVDAQARDRDAQISAQLEAHKQQVQAQQNEMQNRLEAERAHMQAVMDAQLEAQKIAADARLAQMEQQFALLIAHLNNAAKVEVAEIAANTTLQAAQISAAQAAQSNQGQE